MKKPGKTSVRYDVREHFFSYRAADVWNSPRKLNAETTGISKVCAIEI